nr:malonyl-ACP O-methyltransferase BioC [Acinetobacter sp. ANC 4648]
MNTVKIDKSQVAQRFAKAGASYTQHAVVQKKICQHLLQLMQQYLGDTQLNRVFEIGCGSGNLSHLMLQSLPLQQLILNDLYPEVQQHFSHQEKIVWHVGDAEKIEFPTNLDLVASSSVLQWLADLDVIFKKCDVALDDGSYFCFSTFGQHNLKQIKTLTGQGLNYLSMQAIQEKLITHGFEVLYLSETMETLYFEHPKLVLQHLKATGVTATAAKHRWTKQSLQQFYLDYQQFLETNSSAQQCYPLSYHPIYCIARRKP